MRLYTSVELGLETLIETELGDREWQDAIVIGDAMKAYIRLAGRTEKLCELHDKLGQLIHHRLSGPKKEQTHDNKLQLADESIDISEEIRPF